MNNGWLCCVPKIPTVEEYDQLFKSYDIITLHGWLRIIPPDICEKYNIYNGHPGLILPFKYPDLKGKHPQKRAWELKHSEVGCVIHKVTSEVDCGDILMYDQIPNTFNTLDEVYIALHEISTKLWHTFLKDKLGDNQYEDSNNGSALDR
jgi:phosphoribosylglycinamide formyltransferase-1